MKFNERLLQLVVVTVVTVTQFEVIYTLLYAREKYQSMHSILNNTFISIHNKFFFKSFLTVVLHQITVLYFFTFFTLYVVKQSILTHVQYQRTVKLKTLQYNETQMCSQNTTQREWELKVWKVFLSLSMLSRVRSFTFGLNFEINTHLKRHLFNRPKMYQQFKCYLFFYIFYVYLWEKYIFVKKFTN